MRLIFTDLVSQSDHHGRILVVLFFVIFVQVLGGLGVLLLGCLDDLGDEGLVLLVGPLHEGALT